MGAFEIVRPYPDMKSIHISPTGGLCFNGLMAVNSQICETTFGEHIELSLYDLGVVKVTTTCSFYALLRAATIAANAGANFVEIQELDAPPFASIYLAKRGNQLLGVLREEYYKVQHSAPHGAEGASYTFELPEGGWLTVGDSQPKMSMFIGTVASGVSAPNWRLPEMATEPDNFKVWYNPWRN